MNPRELPGAKNPAIGMCNRPRIMLTTSCTRACSYCTIKPERGPTHFRKLTADQWFERFLDFVSLGFGPPIFSGREPTTHPWFVEIIESVPRSLCPVTVYSNFDLDVDERDFDPSKVNWTVTLHRDVTRDKLLHFAKQVKRFKKAKFDIKVDTLGATKSAIDTLLCFALGVPIFQKPWVDKPKPPKRMVRCRYSVRWFGPEGRRWSCSSKMLRGETSYLMGDHDEKPLICHEPTCNACDWWFIHELEEINQ